MAREYDPRPRERPTVQPDEDPGGPPEPGPAPTDTKPAEEGE